MASNTEKIVDIATENAQLSFPELNLSKHTYQQRQIKHGLSPDWNIKVDEVDLSSESSFSSQSSECRCSQCTETSCANTDNEEHCHCGKKYFSQCLSDYSDSDSDSENISDLEGYECTCDHSEYKLDMCAECKFCSQPQNQFTEKQYFQLEKKDGKSLCFFKIFPLAKRNESDCGCEKCRPVNKYSGEPVCFFKAFPAPEGISLEYQCICRECTENNVKEQTCGCVLGYKMQSCGTLKCPNPIKFCTHEKQAGALLCTSTKCINIIPFSEY
jgi:hypothetical protein